MRGKSIKPRVVAGAVRPVIPSVTVKQQPNFATVKQNLNTHVTNGIVHSVMGVPMVGLIPITEGAPTDTPSLLPGYTVIRMDVVNDLLYYFYAGEWKSIAGGTIVPDLTQAFLFEDGTAMLFEDGSQIQWGI